MSAEYNSAANTESIHWIRVKENVPVLPNRNTHLWRMGVGEKLICKKFEVHWKDTCSEIQLTKEQETKFKCFVSPVVWSLFLFCWFGGRYFKKSSWIAIIRLLSCWQWSDGSFLKPLVWWVCLLHLLVLCCVVLLSVLHKHSNRYMLKVGGWGGFVMLRFVKSKIGLMSWDWICPYQPGDISCLVLKCHW